MDEVVGVAYSSFCSPRLAIRRRRMQHPAAVGFHVNLRVDRHRLMEIDAGVGETGHSDGLYSSQLSA